VRESASRPTSQLRELANMHQAQTKPQAQTKLRILLVEDDEDTREIVGEVLRGTGPHSVTLAETGEIGLHHLRARRFDLLVTDIGLPGMSGLEMLDTAEREGFLPTETTVIVSSANHQCARQGVQFLRKPVDEDTVNEIVRARVARASLWRR
jgi:CheY-like chemotaxis protein